jgi:hypothetical protein
MVPWKHTKTLPVRVLLGNSNGMEHDIAIDIDGSSPTLEESLRNAKIPVTRFPSLTNHQDVKDGLDDAGLARGSLLGTLLTLSDGLVLDDGWVRIFGITERACGRTLASWNAPDGWRKNWGIAAAGKLCFADDPMGNQFALNIGVEGQGNWQVLFGSVEERAWKPLERTFGQWLEVLLQGEYAHWYPEGKLAIWKDLLEACPVKASQCWRVGPAGSWAAGDVVTGLALDVVSGTP